MFQKQPTKLWTWMSPNKTKAQIDYIMTRKKWRNSIINSEAYQSFKTIGSDHRIVSVKIRLSLRSSKPTPRKVKYNWKELVNNAQLQERYAIEIKNRFNILIDDEDSISDKYQRFVDANDQAAETCLTKIKRLTKKESRSHNPRIIEERKQLRVAYEAFVQEQDKDEVLKDNYQDKKNNLYNVYRSLEEEDITSKIQEAEKAHSNQKHTIAWKLIKELSDKKTSNSVTIQGDSAETRMQAWKDYFENLLGKAPSVENEDEEINKIFSVLPIEDDLFTMEELHRAKKTLKCGKGCGEDRITPEVLKHVPIDDTLLYFINKTYKEGFQPSLWNVSNIIPIPKSGDLTKTDNYRGISLSSIAGKMYNRMILNRIYPVLDPLLRNSQNGFRQKRTTVGQMMALRRILEGVRTKNLAAVITFIDFKKAFDSIHRGKLLSIIRAYGIPEKLVQAIKPSYEHTYAKVCTPDGET